jgi:hypothetical protein
LDKNLIKISPSNITGSGKPPISQPPLMTGVAKTGTITHYGMEKPEMRPKTFRCHWGKIFKSILSGNLLEKNKPSEILNKFEKFLNSQKPIVFGLGNV